MRPITEYQDYRRFMGDYYEERKRTSVFSWREFAREAGFASPSYLKLVCEGKSSLSRVKMGQVAVAMRLAGYEVRYFEAMVNFGNAKNDEARKRYLGEMMDIARDHEVRVVDKDVFEYYDGWKNQVVRELAPMMPGAMPNEIASACNQEISAQQVRDSLGFLTKAGFLKKQGENVYEQTEKAVVGSKEGLKLAIRSMHREMGKLAVDSIEKFSAEERNVSGVTLGVNREAYERIVRELDACRKKVIAIAAEYSDLDQVYRLNLQLFPLSKEVKGVKEA